MSKAISFNLYDILWTSVVEVIHWQQLICSYIFTLSLYFVCLMSLGLACTCKRSEINVKYTCFITIYVIIIVCITNCWVMFLWIACCMNCFVIAVALLTESFVLLLSPSPFDVRFLCLHVLDRSRFIPDRFMGKTNISPTDNLTAKIH